MRDLLNLLDNVLLNETTKQITVLEAELDATTNNQPNAVDPAEPVYADRQDYDLIIPALAAWLEQAGVADAKNKIEYSKK